MKPWVRWAVLAGSVAVLVILFVVLRPSDDTSDGTSPTPSTPTTSTSPTDSPSAEPERTVIEVTYRDGAVEGPTSFTVTQGDRVRIIVHADVSDEVHFHGYDLMADVTPEEPARIDFVANAAGVYEVELEGPRGARSSNWRSFPDQAPDQAKGGPRRAPGDVPGDRDPGPRARHVGRETRSAGPALALRVRRRRRVDHLFHRAVGAVDGAAVRGSPPPPGPTLVAPVGPDEPCTRMGDPDRDAAVLPRRDDGLGPAGELHRDDRSDRRLRLVLGRSHHHARAPRQPVGHALPLRHDRPVGRLRSRRGIGGPTVSPRVGTVAGGDPALRVRVGGARGPVRDDPRPPRAVDHGVHADPDRRHAPLRTAGVARERRGVRRVLRADRRDSAAREGRGRVGSCSGRSSPASRRSRPGRDSWR